MEIVLGIIVILATLWAFGQLPPSRKRKARKAPFGDGPPDPRY